jgi:non-ribosomal peptide synthetase component F
MSVFDIFGLLAAGGAVVVPETAAIRAPDRWIDWTERERVTIWNSVPGFMEMMLEYAGAQWSWLRCIADSI